ncbi:hypothetical protein [Pseudomonas sp. NY15374]|uniref:hypothetical protein n=1 Tax=Pseudomonas sp. NY15374 TaxID=3400357 RepID=UPI003A83C4AF
MALKVVATWGAGFPALASPVYQAGRHNVNGDFQKSVTASIHAVPLAISSVNQVINGHGNPQERSKLRLGSKFLSGLTARAVK